MEFKHFSHHHGLVLHQPPQASHHDIHCSGCKSHASGDVYACWQCNYFLHGQCFTAARSLKHPSHPHHPLTLVPFPTHPSGSFICNTCYIAGDAFSYSCSACEFDIHVHCAQLYTSNPLVPGANHNPIYPPPIQTSPYPTYNPPPLFQTHQHQINTYNPNNLYPNFTHTNTPPPNEAQNFNNSAFQQSPIVHQNQNFVPPVTNIPPIANPPPQPNATEPIYSTVVNTTPTTNQPKPPTNNMIKHFSHPHPLKPMEIEKKNAKVCSACEREFSGSAYCCTEAQCSFNLHKACFDSARELRHKSHLQHPLTLLAKPPYSDGFTCNACLKDGKAFVYTCGTCSYDLHIDCVQWPDKVTRPDHSHELTLYYSSPAAETSQDVTFMCDVCENPVHDMAWVYYCRECDFGMHLECVTSGIKPENNGGGGETSQEELLRETELNFAVLQLLLQAQGQNAALNSI
ncbi:hypothetical protein CASFOL_033830 [Castilleja foliolosa]|uniref:DC1 domain-containing protein n=1 Tax=Castilleja foliolosa TaxID=1961234 RepID=A0ABD3BZC1_9LAMI